MKQARIWGYLPAFCLAALPLAVQGQSQNELALGTDVTKVNTDAEIRLSISTTDQVQGLQFVFDWPAAGGTGMSLTAGPAIAGADTVVTRVEPTYMVLGVVMDSDGEGDEVISPGDDQHVATATIRASSSLGTVELTFRDGMYATVDGGPLLDNIVVVGGLSIGVTEGLVLTPGSFDVVEGFNRFYISGSPGTTAGGQSGSAQVLMENLAPVEGYVVALCHDASKLTLTSVAAGAAATAAGADFVDGQAFANGGTLGVVIDLVAPFTNNTIPVGEANHIATYNYRCNTIPPAGVNDVSPLTFCDMTLGDPLKENVIVVNGLSVGVEQGLALENGTFTCRGGEAQIPTEICDNGIDDDEDGFIDLEDSDCQRAIGCGTRQQLPNGDLIDTTEGPAGGTAEVCFFIKTPEDDGAAQTDHVQGFSIGVVFCCDLLQARESFDIEGTIIQAVGAEFVSIQVDNGMGEGPLQDGDPECELVIGVLLDSLPPFEGQTIPPSPIYQRVGCVVFDVTADPSKCGECCPIDIAHGVKGRGNVPIKSVLATDNKSIEPLLEDCEVCVQDREAFFRGDCNFMSTLEMPVDIADAAAVVSMVFPIDEFWEFNSPCPDACDCNDDGRLDLADAICILQFLFGQGNRPPKPPGFDQVTGEMTQAGPDPTPDKLDCPGARSCDA